MDNKEKNYKMRIKQIRQSDIFPHIEVGRMSPTEDVDKSSLLFKKLKGIESFFDDRHIENENCI